MIQHDIWHSSAVTTADMYLVVFQETRAAAAAKVAQLLLSHARIRMGLREASQS